MCKRERLCVWERERLCVGGREIVCLCLCVCSHTKVGEEGADARPDDDEGHAEGAHEFQDDERGGRCVYVSCDLMSVCAHFSGGE